MTAATVIAHLAVPATDLRVLDPLIDRARASWGTETVSAHIGMSSTTANAWLVVHPADTASSAPAVHELLAEGLRDHDGASHFATPATLLSERGANAADCAASARFVMAVPYMAPESELENLDRWYEEEHAEMLLRCPVWLRVRRYALDPQRSGGRNRLALHDLTADDVLSRPEVVTSMQTPWRRALAERPWFLTGGRQLLSRR